MTGMRRPELTPALDASQPADHVTRTHPRLIGGSRLSGAVARRRKFLAIGMERGED